MSDKAAPPQRKRERAATPRRDAEQNVELRDRLMGLLSLQLRFRRHMQEGLGVDSAGLTTMIHLAGSGSDTPTAIAHALEASTAATSLMLNRLEASGHITRQPHPNDRRKVIVTPAKASIASAYELANPVIAGIDRLTASLTPEQRSTVAGFIEGLTHVYDAALIQASRESTAVSPGEIQWPAQHADVPHDMPRRPR